MATVLRNGGGSLLSAPAPKLDVGRLPSEILRGAGDYFAWKTQYDQAKYGAKIAKANLQNQLAATRAGGLYQAEAARAGLPSPSLLLVSGLGVGLAALLLLRR